MQKKEEFSLTPPSREENKNGDRSHPITHSQSHFKHHTPQDFRQLRMRKTQGPQTEIGGSV